ncbi:hypothetical protein EHI42_08760 [Rhizobium hidalgonense]|nr:hypothetical protein EHI42_08760 [Rhizobium hidalgonense]
MSWAKRQAASKTLEQQTERIADALLRAGIDVVLDGDVTLIGAVTGVVEHQRVYRAVRFLPTVAGRDRRPMVNGLKLFMAGHKNSKHFRYAVMTCATPVPVDGDLRGAIRELSRRISKWVNRIKRFGVKVLFRGVEFTRKTAEERGMSDRHDADAILYHVHANVIYWPTKAMKSGEWESFLKDTRTFMGAEWKDNGKVERVEEIVKYCSKPTDTLAASDNELVWLYRETTRLKICQPLGDFKLWLKELEKLGEKVVRVHVGGGEGRLMRVRKRKKPGKDSTPVESGKPENDTESDTPADAERKAPPSNIVLGLTLPQWRHTPWAEPLIMVQRYDPAKSSGEGGGDIEAWKARAREDWDGNFGPEPAEALRVARMALDAAMSEDDIREAAEAAPYIVHTCSSTVPTGGDADEEVPPEELDDNLREVVSLFEGGTVVRLMPRSPAEEDEIPFEAPDVVARWAKMRADLAVSAARLLERRATLVQVPGQSPEPGCRIAA